MNNSDRSLSDSVSGLSPRGISGCLAACPKARFRWSLFTAAMIGSLHAAPLPVMEWGGGREDEGFRGGEGNRGRGDRWRRTGKRSFMLSATGLADVVEEPADGDGLGVLDRLDDQSRSPRPR